MTESQYLTVLSAFPYFGPARTDLLIRYFGNAKDSWNASARDLTKIGIVSKKAFEFIKFRDGFDASKYFEKLRSLNISVVTKFDSDYPQNLNGLPDAPMALYVRGKILRRDKFAVSIVGTRMMTTYGKEVASKFATGLAEYGITVVSGLALGIDAEAQRAAIRAGGRSIAVLASGLDIISPLTNKSLALDVINGKGALISENPLGHNPFKQDFAVRNRLISGLSKAVLVVEGRMKSGTFHTVTAANSQGRPVFAVPGPVTSPASEGPNYLVQNGANVAITPRDILDELGIEIKVVNGALDQVLPTDPIQIKIIELLDKESLHLDELVRISGVNASLVSARLTIMEMKGLVKHVGAGVYRKVG